MSTWLTNYNRELELKNLIIVYGYVKDYCKDEEGYIIIEDKLLKTLKNRRDKIIIYDGLEKIEFLNLDKKEIYDILDNHAKGEYKFESNKISKVSQVSSKRLENNNNSSGNSMSLLNREKSLENNDDIDTIMKDFICPDKFIQFINTAIKINNEINIFIKNGDNLFGKLNSDETLNQEQFTTYKYLKKCVDLINDNSANHRNIVIVMDKLSYIPSVLHLNNFKVSKIQVALPTRTEKEKYVIENIENFNIEMANIYDFVDSLDGLTLDEISQIGKLSTINNNRNYKQLLSQYRYGKDENPWADIRKEKIKSLREIIGNRVKGQEEAIRKVNDILIKAYTGISGIQHSINNVKPKGILFFVGPTGVGKTELAKTLAEFLFGDESACIRFDMSEYNMEHSDQRLIGAPPGFVGYESGGQLTNKVKERPFSVLLFDEIEKAHNKILDKFLQILEDGRLTDGKGETVYFSDSIIIFTSNIGTDKITVENTNSKFLFKEAVKTYFKEILGRPELLNRIGEDNIIVFDFIKDRNFLKDIVISKLKNIDKILMEKYNNAVIEYINRDNIFLKLVSNSNLLNGGRGALNDLEKYLITPLSEFLFFNEDEVKNSKIIAEYDEDLEEFDFKIMRK